MSKKLRIAVDFDGVIHAYTSKWTTPDEISDAPVEGAFAWLRELLAAGHAVVIYSCRFTTRFNAVAGLFVLNDEDASPNGMDSTDEELAERVHAMNNWFAIYDGEDICADLNFHIFTGQGKPHANVYVDDRGFRFEGTFPTLAQLAALNTTWNHGHHG